MIDHGNMVYDTLPNVTANSRRRNIVRGRLTRALELDCSTGDYQNYLEWSLPKRWTTNGSG